MSLSIRSARAEDFEAIAALTNHFIRETTIHFGYQPVDAEDLRSAWRDAGKHPWLVAELEKVVLPYHLDSAKQAGGRLALRYVDDMEARVSFVIGERRRVTERLQQLAVHVWPSGANFVLFRPERRHGQDVWQGLLDRGVLVRNCSSWPRLDGCLRVTIGTVQEDDAFLTALEEVLSP